MSPGGLAKKLLAFVGIVLLIQLGLVAWMLAADSGIDLQSIQVLPSASGASLYIFGWNYAGISDASTWDWTVTYTVTYSAN